MKAMILAAGKGTRLQPLTDFKPKALVEIEGKPLLEIIIQKVISAGFREIVINVHHFADQIYEFLEKHKNFGVDIQVSDESDLLLDTGGGLMKARTMLSDGDPVLVHNVDIISGLNLRDFYDWHCRIRPLASMAVKERNTSRSLLIDDQGILCGWKNNITGEIKHAGGELARLHPIAFSAVHILSQEIFEHITESGVFSIMDVYLRLAKHYTIATYRHDQDYWLDLGRIENIEEAADFLRKIKQ